MAMPDHGTRWAYVGGCRCVDCLEAESTYSRRVRALNQQRTATAKNWWTPWTPADDEVLVNGEGTVLERAVGLGRTYYACVSRLRRLNALDGWPSTGTGVPPSVEPVSVPTVDDLPTCTRRPITH